jgi:hypothetical protein
MMTNACHDIPNVVDLLAAAMNDTLCALMECALSRQSAMPTTVTNHLQATITATMPNFQMPTSGGAFTQKHFVPT